MSSTKASHSEVKSFGYDLFREIYYAELDRKDRVEQQLSFPFAIMIVVASAALYCIRSAIHSESTFYAPLLTAICVVVMCLLAVAAVLLGLAYYANRGYRHVSYADQLKEHSKTLEEWARQVADAQGDDISEREMRRVLADQFATCAATNARHNDIKTRLLSSAKLTLLCTALGFVLCASYPAYRTERATSDVRKVLITAQQQKGGDITNGVGEQGAKESASASASASATTSTTSTAGADRDGVDRATTGTKARR